MEEVLASKVWKPLYSGKKLAGARSVLNREVKITDYCILDNGGQLIMQLKYWFMVGRILTRHLSMCGG